MALRGDTSDLERLVYGGKPILPEQQSYSVETQDGTVISSVPGGLPKTALQYFDQPYKTSVTYNSLDGFKALYLEDFFNRHQGQAFIANLLIGNTETEEFVVKYLGTSKHNKTGFNGSMSIDLIVEPAIDRCFQAFLAEYAPCMGSDTAPVFCYANLGIKALP